MHSGVQCIYWGKRYCDAHIAWGKYRMARIIGSVLFPHDDDKGDYTFNYLIQKIDCLLDEYENKRLELWEQTSKIKE
jgi:hypothetical protein